MVNWKKSPFFRAGLVIFALAAILLVVMFPPESVPAGKVSQAWLQQGPYPVGVEPFIVEDVSRPTAVNGDFEGSASRELKGKVWFPLLHNIQPPISFPLVVYSHGFMSFHQEGAYLAEFLAGHGYVVVAVDYPLTNYFAPGNPNLSDVVNQPADVSFVIDKALERKARGSDLVFGSIDEKRIAVMGLSLGGMTTELVTFDPRMSDERIKAAISIAGPARMFTDRFFSFAQVPFMMIAGDQDAIVPYELNAQPIRQHDPDSVLVTLRGGSHAGFAGIASVLFRWVKNPDSFGCASIKKNIKEDSNPFTALVSEQYGVVDGERKSLCENSDHLPRAMRPAQQQMFTTLAAFSFLESLFNPDPLRRNQAAEFLLRAYPAENPEVLVDAGDYRRDL